MYDFYVFHPLCATGGERVDQRSVVGVSKSSRDSISFASVTG